MSLEPDLRPSEEGPAEALARLERPLLTRIRRMMGPEAREGAESKDVLQSVYAEALQGLRAGRLVGAELLPWMTEVARHKIVDEVRRRRERELEGRASALVAGEPRSLGSGMLLEEDRRALADALAELEPERRRVVALRCEDGWPWQRIAGALGRSEEAVRKLYHRSLLELGRSLARRKVGTDPVSASG